MKLEMIPDGMPLHEALGYTFGSAADELYKGIVQRVGEEPGEELGHGMWGVVYSLPSGKALKITASPGEVRAMKVLREVNHPNIVRVHDVFTAQANGRGVGVVVRDAVDEILRNVLDQGRSNLLNIAKTNAAMAYDKLSREGMPEGEALDGGMKAFTSYLRKWRAEPLFPGIISGVEKLRKLGLVGIDLHEANIGVDDPGTAEERPVIFDIGA
jgi:serine/threonine protein kinase